MLKHLTKFRTIAAASVLALAAQAIPAGATECIAPADPGGGWDFTCRTVGRLLTEEKLVDGNVQVTNMPGGVGAVAFANVISKRNSDADLLVATSTVGITQIAQGKYPAGIDKVRFAAMLGADVGVIAVPKDSKFKNLKEFLDALKDDPSKTVVAGSTAVGGWDHIRLMLLAKADGVDTPGLKKIRWVQFDGGSPAVTQMMGGQVQAVSTDLGEIAGFVESGDIRLLAVLSDDPIPAFPKQPTAKSQGFDVTGYNWRGFYVPKGISDKQYTAWVDKLHKLYDSDAWKKAAKDSGLTPIWRGGKEFETFVADQEKQMEQVSRDIGVIK